MLVFGVSGIFPELIGLGDISKDCYLSLSSVIDSVGRDLLK